MSVDTARRLDRLAAGDTVIHRMESRAKILVAAAFLVCVASFPKYAVAELLPLVALPLLWGSLGRVPPAVVLRFLAGAAPFAVMVGIWNPLLDRELRALPGGFDVPGGWISFASILLRFALSAGLVVVLTATTPLPRLLHGLVRLGVPKPLVLQVHLLYRYLFLVTGEARRMNQARVLRQPARPRPTLSTARRLLGSLLWRTWDRAERIYRAMKVRGFDGDIPLLRDEVLRPADAAVAGLCAAACVACRWMLVAPG
jgi:cobalt/nickel transport system permease protein